MAMMIRFTGYLALFSLLFCGTWLHGQEKDFQTWHELEVDKDVTDRLGISGELELRMENNSRQLDRTLLTLSSSYTLNDYFVCSAGIRTLLALLREGGLEQRYRLHTDFTGKYVFYDIDFSLRLRVQYGFEEGQYFKEYLTNSLVNRNKFKAAYHIFGTRFDVQASLETWGLLSGGDGIFFTGVRYGAGLSYNLNFDSQIGLRYILEGDINQVNPLQKYIVVLAYAYSF